MITQALIGAAIDILRWVGRWVLRRIGQVGRKRIIAYMEEKIDLFYALAKGAFLRKQTLREGWYRFRARNWTRAVKWLKDHALRLGAIGARTVDKRILDRVPDQVECETFEGWRKTCPA